jgi:hypothetical protein
MECQTIALGAPIALSLNPRHPSASIELELCQILLANCFASLTSGRIFGDHKVF